MPIYRGDGGSGTGSSGKPGGGTGGDSGSTGPITTKDVLLTNPVRATHTTQEDANQYFAQSIDDLNASGGGGGGTGGTFDNYEYWRLQANYGTPYNVVSKGTVNFEGSNGIDVTRVGDTIVIDGANAGGGGSGASDNYQYWQYKVDGFNTTAVQSMQDLDFQSGNGITITKKGSGIEISATGSGGGTSGPVEWADIQNKPVEILNLTGENTSNQSLVSGGSF